MPHHGRFVVGVAGALLLASTSADVRAGSQPQSEKCDDLQTRCLHRENAVCQVWRDECVTRSAHAASHGAHRSRKVFGHKPRV